jgi:outer membrane protein TolC
MMRLGLLVTAFVLPALFLAGCQQHRLLTEADLNRYRSQALHGADNCPLEPDTHSALLVTSMSQVLQPEGKHREISLAECLALALENGRTAEFFDRTATGRSSVSGSISAARANISSLSDSIRVFAYDQAIVATEIEESLAKFDVRWQTAAAWNKTDEQQSLQSAVFTGSPSVQREGAQVQTQLLKPLPSGGLTAITFRTDYDYSSINRNLADRGVANPSYTPSLELIFEQPLWRGNGVFINELLDRHPGGIQSQFNAGGRVPGILLTRIALDQVGLEFENRVQAIAFEVEQAYWQLYCAYWDLFSREEAMRQAHHAWQIAQIKYETGKSPGQELAQIAQQFHLFRAQRLSALGKGGLTGRPGVLEAERRLRYVVGLPPDDGCRLIPIDAPTVAPYVPDWSLALNDAMRRRPELIQVRMDIQANQLTVLREKDGLLPDLRFFSNYKINGLGNKLEGDDEGNALRNLVENKFHDWTMGLRMEVLLGYREAHAEVRRAQLGLAQRVAFLQDGEMRVAFGLSRAYRDIFETYETIRIQRARRLEAANQLKLEYKRYLSGSTEINVMLEAQRNWADALRDEHFAICDYNVALVDFERQKGTILDRDNISILEGPMPACAEARASAHIRDRARAILVKEPVNPGIHACTLDAPDGTLLTVPDPAAVESGAQIPNLFEQRKALPPMPEELPLPKPKADGPAGSQEALQRLEQNPLPGSLQPAPARVILPPAETEKLKTKPRNANVVIPAEAIGDINGPSKATVTIPADAGSHLSGPSKANVTFTEPPAASGAPAKARVSISPDPLTPPVQRPE